MPEHGDYIESQSEKLVSHVRKRPSARLLVTSPQQRVLLFRFVHKSGALAGRAYWATPGGGVEHGESFADAAVRELREETGIHKAQVSQPVGQREVPLQLPDGEHVLAIEKYFVVDSDTESISRDGWTAEEMEVMENHKWWSRAELFSTNETIFPEGLVEMLDGADVFGTQRPFRNKSNVRNTTLIRKLRTAAVVKDCWTNDRYRVQSRPLVHLVG